MKRIFLLVVFIIFYSAFCFADYSITLDGQSRTLEDHPRLLPVPVATLQAKTSSNPLWTQLLSQIDGYMDSYWNTSTHTWATNCAALPTSEMDGVLGVMYSMALYYYMYPNGTNDGVAAIEYGRFAKEFLNSMAGETCGYGLSTPYTSNVNRDFGSIHLRYMALIWDLIYNVDGDALISGDSTFQGDFLTFINDVMIPMVEAHEIYSSTAYGFDSDWSKIPPESNLMITAWRGRMAIGLATYEDNEAADGHGTNSSTNNSEIYLENAWDFWEDSMLPLRNTVMQGGHGLDGSHYQLNRTSFYVLEAMNFLTTAISEENVFNSVTGNWVEEQGIFNIYRTLTDPTKLYIEGRIGDHDYALGTNWPRAVSDILIIANKYDTTSARQARDYVESVYDPETNVSDIIYHYMADWFIYWNDDGGTSDYTQLVESYHADGSDVFISRTGWGTDDTWMHSRAAKSWAAQHDDTNSSNNTDFTRGQGRHTGSYTIWCDGEYLLYENIPGTNTEADDVENYNILRIGETVENYSGSTTVTGGLYPSSGMTYDYSGGYLYAAGNPDMDRTVVGTVPMRYVRANLDDAYVRAIETGGGGGADPIADHVYRSFVHSSESSGANYVIVHEYADKYAGNTDAVEARLHYPGNPTVSGSTITYTGSSAKIITEVVYPSSPTINETDVTNNTTKIADDDVYQVDIVLGTDNIESALIVHYPSNNTSSTMPGINLIDETEIYGCHIEDSTTNRVIVFSRDDSYPANDIEYTIARTVETTRHFIADLNASTNYYVTASDSASNLTIAVSTSNPGSSTLINSGTSGTAVFLTTIDVISTDDEQVIPSATASTATMKCKFNKN